jgi:F-type H+-transporting ATPase subunit delta
VSQSASLSSGVAARYASALFDLALADNKLGAVEKDLTRFDALLQGSEDLARLVKSPVFSTDDQVRAIGSVLDKAKITGLVGNFMRIVAQNRRAFAMPLVLGAFQKLLADHRGEETAQVSVAAKLKPAQTKELKAALKSVVGKDVDLQINIDPSLLGGMIVKIGSRQIDTSLRTKLSSLKLALKEVG